MEKPPAILAARPQKFTAVLLAGGHSRRMGSDKALIEWEGLLPLWEFQLKKLRTLDAQRVLVSCREAQGLLGPAEFVFDPPDVDDGPLGAITRCLELVQMPLLVLAVDMPWMPRDFLGERVLRGGFFRGEHGIETLAAVYEPQMLPLMQRALRERRLSLQRVIEEAAPAFHEITPGERSFFRNANAPEELMEALDKNLRIK